MSKYETQLQKLATQFPEELIKNAPEGKFGSYISHSTINERLLYAIGPFGFRVDQVIKGTQSEKVEAVICTLTAEIDGRIVEVSEVGECENPDNWKTEGARLKDAMSDALKRCAMRIGCALHLWSYDKASKKFIYKLDGWLKYDSLEDEPQEETPDLTAPGETAGTVVGGTVTHPESDIVTNDQPHKIGMPTDLEQKTKDHLPRVRAITNRVKKLESGERSLWDTWFDEHIGKALLEDAKDSTKWDKKMLSAMEVKLTEIESEAANSGPTL